MIENQNFMFSSTFFHVKKHENFTKHYYIVECVTPFFSYEYYLQKYQNHLTKLAITYWKLTLDPIDVALVSLLLTLNIFHTFF